MQVTCARKQDKHYQQVKSPPHWTEFVRCVRKRGVRMRAEKRGRFEGSQRGLRSSKRASPRTSSSTSLRRGSASPDLPMYCLRSAVVRKHRIRCQHLKCEGRSEPPSGHSLHVIALAHGPKSMHPTSLRAEELNGR